ncbi:hypothetical protein GYMLUDRAFT_39497 [Collybiopsis luxurians FD-317 M1]|nr:hypothetical protein GYMLUDRAFT_39497 [Collybiopsis luxurians FD-317 M1]
MGSAKKQNKSYRTRATRSTGRSNLLTSDPLQNTVLLNNQLRSLGLYAAPTIGDGNCLFRALSDQYYGSPSRHDQVRREICDFIETHPERYEGFVDVDEFGDSGVRKGKGGGLAAYVAGMRQNATYGGHMELSAFAHLTKRNIKVIQPGLVYVIQCDPQQPKSPKSASKKPGDSPSKHTRSNTSKDLDIDGDTSMSLKEDQESTIYVAYHDWEHFSSVRNLRGPHSGVPSVHETAPPPTAESSSSASPPPEEHLPPSKARKKERERKEKERKEAARVKAKEKASSNAEKPKSSQRTGFKLKIPPRALPPPPTLSMTAATPISAGASPLSSLPPSPTAEDRDDLLDAVTVPLPPSAPRSVATSPAVSHSPSPAPCTSSDQLSDPEDAEMNSPGADLSATVTLPKSASSAPSDQPPTAAAYPYTYASYPLSFVPYPYSYGSYPAHLTQKTPTATTASYSFPSLPVSNIGSSSAPASVSTSHLSYYLSQTFTTSQGASTSSGGSSTATAQSSTPMYFPANPSAVAIDPLSNLTHLTHLLPPPRAQRSPKRSFEESVSEEGSAESGISTSSTESKRSRMEILSEDPSEAGGGQQAHTGMKIEDSPELAEHTTLPSLRDDDPQSTDADHGHHSDKDAKRSGAHGPGGMSSRVSESSDDDGDGDDDNDEDYVDEEEENNDDDEDDRDEDDLEPNHNRTRSFVPPKVARNRHASGSGDRPLTRRQRKKLGLPKPRTVTPGKIAVSGGLKSSKPSVPAEWTANGNGRVDVRGFRELKI